MENTKINKIFIAVIFFLLAFILVNKCKDKGVNYHDKVTITSDTTRVTHIDTIPFFNKYDSIRWINLPLISYETDTNNLGLLNYTYVTAMEDSLLSGKISSLVASDGTLVNQNFTYLPKFPKYIVRTDSIVVNNKTTETIVKYNNGIYVGVMGSIFSNINVIPTVGYQTKNNTYMGVGYEPFKKDIYLEFKIKLINGKFKRNN